MLLHRKEVLQHRGTEVSVYCGRLPDLLNGVRFRQYQFHHYW